MEALGGEPRGEVFYRSPAVNWEIFPTGHPDAVIHRVRSMGGTRFFVTDRSGRNFKYCSDMEDCYRIVEEQCPWVMLDGKRSDGAREIDYLSPPRFDLHPATLILFNYANSISRLLILSLEALPVVSRPVRAKIFYNARNG